MRFSWLAAPLLLITLAGVACGDNDTNRELDQARETATGGSNETPSTDETAEPGGTEVGGTETVAPETPDEGNGNGEGQEERIGLNIREPKRGDVVPQRRPTIIIRVRNAQLKGGDTGVQAVVFVDQEPDLTAPPPADVEKYPRRDIRLPRLEPGEHTIWVALIDNATDQWVAGVEADRVTFVVDPNAEPAEGEEEPNAEESTPAEGEAP
jgi:hypothetical protein